MSYKKGAMTNRRATKSFTARLDVEVLERLGQESRRTGQSNARVAERLIDEGLRMSEFPGLVFRSGPLGRRASLIDGPDVWEVVRELKRAIAEDVSGPIEATAQALGLAVGQVELAAGYYDAHTSEIDERLGSEELAAERVRRTLAGSRAG